MRNDDIYSMSYEEARRRGAYEIDPIMPDGRFLHQWLAVLGFKKWTNTVKTGLFRKCLNVHHGKRRSMVRPVSP